MDEPEQTVELTGDTAEEPETVQTEEEADKPESERTPEATETKTEEETEEKTEDKEEVDLDLNDPELAQAALKIQSGFRGHLARKEIDVVKVCCDVARCRLLSRCCTQYIQ